MSYVFLFCYVERRRSISKPTSSEAWGGVSHEKGKYPAKIYTIDGMLIYQEDNGGDNTSKSPLGGVIYQSSAASYMLNTIANPITYYGGAVINQSGHSGDLYNYYWTSYSRGTDGRTAWPNNEPNWHNVYLDGYIPLRVKSIYDPCPYLYRIPSNGTWNQFASNPGWTINSYLGGDSWDMNTLGISWLAGLGRREAGSSVFEYTGSWGFYFSSTVSSQTSGYTLAFSADKTLWNNHNGYVRSYSHSVRCIEDNAKNSHRVGESYR